ncbi:hypothetical protein AB0C02_27095 [Micromonospora sp. NPDC048999]|uniref:hypothetical protein n=1 Tax=Micromonospora sp. NPDC048999 TaxID=3155391 RepID=UPI0033C6117F
MSLLVALVWHLIVIIAVLAPGAPAVRDCSQTCLEWISLTVYIGGPILAGSLLITLLMIGLLRRWIASSILTGTVSALFGVVPGAAVGVVLFGSL